MIKKIEFPIKRIKSILTQRGVILEDVIINDCYTEEHGDQTKINVELIGKIIVTIPPE